MLQLSVIVVLYQAAWIFGAVFCKLVSYLQGVSVSASVNAMMFVAVDRYMAISSPLVPKKSKR